MLLTLSTTHQPATDLGYLLHKNPARPQSFDLPFGRAHVFYPEVGEQRCTAALMLEVDSVGLVRDRSGPPGEGHALAQYVNDRPYVASSFLSVAISRVFGTALSGRCKDRPELVQRQIPLQACLSALPCRGGVGFLKSLFEPLGYHVHAVAHALDPEVVEWGESRYVTVTLEGCKRLDELLTHLYVLVPVLDDDKHYWVGDEEVEKLLRFGEGWLAEHPQREAIARRYLRHQRRLVRQALARLVEDGGLDPVDALVTEEAVLETPLSLAEERTQAVVSALSSHGAKRVLDLGCGEGKLLRALMRDRSFTSLVGMDVCWRSLEIAGERLDLDRLPDAQKGRVTLLHGSLMYRDRRLKGFDGAAVVEVIEHLEPSRLAAFERVVFEFARPSVVIITTPNAEYNVRFPSLPPGGMRHRDHRFEWTRSQFAAWCQQEEQRFGYRAQINGVGAVDPEVGTPTQMAVLQS